MTPEGHIKAMVAMEFHSWSSGNRMHDERTHTDFFSHMSRKAILLYSLEQVSLEEYHLILAAAENLMAHLATATEVPMPMALQRPKTNWLTEGF